MKFPNALPLLVCLCLLSAPANGRAPKQTPGQQEQRATPRPAPAPAATATAPAKIDPVKEADIRRLMQLGGGVTAANQMMVGMMNNMRPMMTNAFPPGEYRDKLITLFFEKFRSKADVQQLLELNVQLYDKYLTDEDIKGLIQFYSTPLGQKTLNVLPKLAVEAQGEGSKWGENLGRQSMLEVLAEHPEIAQELKDAQSKAPARQ